MFNPETNQSKLRFITKDLLIEINNKAVEQRRQRSLIEKHVAELPDLQYPILMVMTRQDYSIRVMILLTDGKTFEHYVQLDMSFEDFGRLPESPIPNHTMSLVMKKERSDAE